MKIAILTNISSPYKSLQINEFCKLENTDFTVYYTEPNNKKIEWEEKKAEFLQVSLKQINMFSKFGLILNKGLFNIVRRNELLILTGYDQLSMIFISIICRFYNRPYIVLFDGISRNRIELKESKLKIIFKKIVLSQSRGVMANGLVSRLYLTSILGYPNEKIYNQYLSVDNKTLELLSLDKQKHRDFYRAKYNIDSDSKVLLFSGRLIEKKNIEKVILAISILKRKDIIFLITGGGELNRKIQQLADDLAVKVIITGFINEQEELFKHYFAADVLILPSKEEPWGLVVNECMAAGLPVIVSKVCGCSLDLVKDNYNGYTIDPMDEVDIAEKINQVLFSSKIDEMGKNSKEIISKWTFENSKKMLAQIIRERVY